MKPAQCHAQERKAGSGAAENMQKRYFHCRDEEVNLVILARLHRSVEEFASSGTADAKRTLYTPIGSSRSCDQPREKQVSRAQRLAPLGIPHVLEVNPPARRLRPKRVVLRTEIFEHGARIESEVGDGIRSRFTGLPPGSTLNNAKRRAIFTKEHKENGRLSP
jgi:hypothetical protein